MNNFIKKCFIVFLFSIAFMFIIGDLVHVGDNIIHQKNSKNYVGYFSLNDENNILMFSDMFTYNSLENAYTSYLYNNVPPNKHINIIGPYLVNTIDDGLLMAGFIEMVNISNNLYIWYVNISTGYKHSHIYNLDYDDFVINIYGISNYEVTP
jgi:hypothetical protein